MKTWTWMSLIALATGCVGTDVGNPPGDDERRSLLEFRAVDDDVTDPGALTTGNMEVAAAWISLQSVVVQPNCSGTPRRIEGPFYVDLNSGEMLPSPVVIEGDFDEICGLNLELGPAGDDAPAELVGLSALVTGEGPEGPVTVESSTQRVLPYVGENFVIGDDQRFIGAFDPTDWFAHDAPGEGAASHFFTALKRDSRIVPDKNDDGEVSRAEYIEPVALPRP